MKRVRQPVRRAQATMRLWQWVTKGTGTSAKALLIAYGQLRMVPQRWRCLNASHLLATVPQEHFLQTGYSPTSNDILPLGHTVDP